MAYCRWSSDNWKCDLYCYEDARGGWTTHIAGRRRVGLDSLPDDPFTLLGKVSSEEIVRLHRKHFKVLGGLPFEEITLPHAGETFNDPDLESFKARLLHLRSVGYHFPDYVLEEVNDEIVEASALNIHERPEAK